MGKGSGGASGFGGAGVQQMCASGPDLGVELRKFVQLRLVPPLVVFGAPVFGRLFRTFQWHVAAVDPSGRVVQGVRIALRDGDAERSDPGLAHARNTGRDGGRGTSAMVGGMPFAGGAGIAAQVKRG